MNGIVKLKSLIDNYKIEEYKIIINTNIKINFNFKYKLINIEDELKSLLFAIEYFDIKDNDFIIKINGNMILKTNNKFMKEIIKIDDNIDVISRYLFSDLFGIRSKYIKMIEDNDERFELRLEKIKLKIEEKKQIELKELGININPNSKSKSKFTIY